MKEFIKDIKDFFTIIILLILSPLIIYDWNKEQKEWKKKYDAASDEEKKQMNYENFMMGDPFRI